MLKSIKLGLILSLLIFCNQARLEAQSTSEYYQSAEGLTGEELKAELHRIIRNHTTFTYSEVREIIRDIDEDPNNPDNIILFYSNRSIDKQLIGSGADDWNREHVWAKSKGFPNESDTAYRDVHHLRPADASVNSDKSNKDFDYVDHIEANVQGEAPDTYTNSDAWEPRDEVKGDVARMMFYMDVRYNSSTFDLAVVDYYTESGKPEHGKFSALLEWHVLDPVSQEEIDRNERIFADYQGNRNPFVDHPEWVGEIFGEVSAFISISTVGFGSDFGNVAVGAESGTSSYVVSGTSLSTDISIVAPDGFQISTDNSTFVSQLTLTQLSGTVEDQTIYVRFSPTEEREYSGAIAHTSDGALLKEVMVSGIGGEASISTIAEAKQMNDENVTVKAIVTTPDYGFSNGQYFIQDNTGGINIFHDDNFGLVSPGDSVLIRGTVGSFASQQQIAVISVEVINSSNPLPDPVSISVSDLSVTSDFQGSYVALNNVALLDASQWPTLAIDDGSGVNVDASSNGTDFIIRIDRGESFYDGSTPPDGLFTIKGTLARFNDDVQIFPWFEGDVSLQDDGGNTVTSSADAIQKDASVYPNPTGGGITIESSGVVHQVRVTTMDGKLVKSFEYEADNYYDLGDLMDGIYILSIDKEKSTVNRKVIIDHQ